MHTFQPYPMDMLDWNPMTKISNEWFALVSSADDKLNAMTCSWGAIGHIWGKNATTVYVRESRYTKQLLDNSDYYSICFLDPEKKDAKSTLKYLGMVSGKDEDKIKGARFDINYSEHGIPYIDQSNLVLLCKKMAAIPMTEDSIVDDSIADEFYKNGDYHTMYIGELLGVLAR